MIRTPMNFLAHLYLADPTPESMLGNLLPDFVRCRGAIPGEMAWPAEVLRGIARHRRVDAFTDSHPLFHRSKARLFEAHGRYSGILVDVLYDHALATHWARYHDEPLRAFAERVYAGLESLPRDAAGEADEALRFMRRQDWLTAYATTDGIALTLRRMSRRFSQRFGREVALEAAVETFAECREGFEGDFHAFFPQLVAYVGALSLETTPPQREADASLPCSDS